MAPCVSMGQSLKARLEAAHSSSTAVPSTAGNVLAAELGLGAQRRPAVVAELLVGVLESLGHGHAVGRPMRAFAIATLAERLEHHLRKPGRFAEHGVGGLAAVFGKFRAGPQLLRAQ